MDHSNTTPAESKTSSAAPTGSPDRVPGEGRERRVTSGHRGFEEIRIDQSVVFGQERPKRVGDLGPIPRDIGEHRLARVGIEIERAIEQRAERSPKGFVESKHLC